MERRHMYTRNFPALPSLIAAAVASLGLTVAVPAAEPPTHDHEHSAVTSQSAPTDTRPMEAMQRMQAMHEKWMAAKTTAERQALMTAHMQAMQEAMKTMQHMGQGTGQGGMSGAMMQQRMDMMTMMMQMMMDREGSMLMSAPKASAPK
jgi:hypothetical protein